MCVDNDLGFQLVQLRVPARLPPSLKYPDIGPMAKWSVSSYKFGFGPECLQDGDPETFWQYVYSKCSGHV